MFFFSRNRLVCHLNGIFKFLYIGIIEFLPILFGIKDHYYNYIKTLNEFHRTFPLLLICSSRLSWEKDDFFMFSQ